MTASLALLKGTKKTDVAAELEKPAPATEEKKTTAKANVSVVKKEPEPEPAQAAAPAADEEVEVDVDTMSSKELDVLVGEHNIEVPDEWKKMTVGQKRTWLKEQFEDGGSTEAVADAPAEETKAVDPAPATGTAVAAPKASKPAKKAGKVTTGEVLEPDALSDMVSEIENLKEKDAKDLVGKLAEQAEFTYFKLGGVLSVIQVQGWFQPYASFREYVEKEHGIQYRKAMYWVAIYNDLSAAKIPWEKVKGLGWTKLKEIAELLTPENVDEWVQIAASQTTLQLIETVSNAKKQNAPKSIEDQSSKTVTTKTFKVHEDQKATIEAALTKAKEASGTTVDTVALEFICMDYLGSTPKGLPLKDQLQKSGIEAALEALGEAFPDANFSVELPEDAAA